MPVFGNNNSDKTSNYRKTNQNVYHSGCDLNPDVCLLFYKYVNREHDKLFSLILDIHIFIILCKKTDSEHFIQLQNTILDTRSVLKCIKL